MLRRADLDVCFERRGTGERLLVFNGSGATIETSAPLIDTLAAHFDVLVHDQRGLGRTGPPCVQPTMADYALDAIALLDHVGWAATRVFGISFGGMVAQEFAVAAPHRVQRLALLCTSAGGAGGSSYPLHELDRLAPAERARVRIRNLDTRFDAQWLADHPGDEAIVRMMADRVAAPRTVAQARGEAMQLEARSHHDVWDRLPAISCPTLVACGRFDGLAPASNSEAIALRIAGSELRCYEGGHLFAYQDRRAMPEIVSFLSA
jgi:pimeloyl-ACP methyl ester carboxylesterase